jgi:hypothetical protein
MPLAGKDFEAVAGMEDEVVTFNFERQFSFEDKEELVGVDVGVAFFGCAGRHELFDDADSGGLYEVPAVTVVSLWTTPFVVLG